MPFALAAQDTVSLTVSTAALPYGANGVDGPVVQQQPPQFGVVASGTGGPPFVTVDVFWQNGTFALAVPIEAFDKIGAPNGGDVTTFQGRFVEGTDQSGEYQGTVVMLFTRDHTGTPGGTLAVVRTNAHTYREAPVSSLSVVEGR